MKIAECKEILLKGRTLFRGYVEGKRIIRVVDEEGWFPSGDLGYIDKDGYLYVTGRKDNMFISGGENIQPEEIEACLVRIDCVEEAAVVPIRHHEFGHRPAAFLKIEPNCNLRHHPIIKELEEMLPPMIKELEEMLPSMIKEMEEMLPHFKVPDYFFPWPEEGNQGPMKVDRKLLKKIAEDLIQRKMS